MEKEIIEILKSRMNEADIYGMEVLAIDINDINALAKELDALFALRGVVKSLKEKEEIAFEEWLKTFKEVNGCYWFDKETLYIKEAMKDIYDETVKHQL
jgi:adenylate kinase family enzyme